MNSFRNRCPAPTRQDGSALMIAVGMAVPLLIAGGSLLVAVAHERTVTESSIVRMQARDVSVSGAQNALARLAADPNFTGSYEVAMGGPLAQVTVTAWAGDRIDNDQDGTVDDAHEAEFVSIVSEGSSNVEFDVNGNVIDSPSLHASSVTEAVVHKVPFNIAVNQALYVDDPLADFTFNGDAFMVSGEDANINGTKGPKAPLPGIGTPGDPNLITSQLSSKQRDNVVGLGGYPSIRNVSVTDLTQMINALGKQATTVWNGPDDHVSGAAIGDRTHLKSSIARAKGDLKLSGSTTGCGILIVDGDLDLTGTFDFVGIIIVAGGVTIRGGGGSKDLHGGLLTLGAVSGEDIEIGGTVQLRYSSQAITLVNSQLSGGIELVSWIQR